MPQEYGPIQTAPSGLLGFLNLKNVGRNPDSLSSSVVPIIDVGEWYRQTSVERVNGLARAFVGGVDVGAGFASWAGVGPVVVPQNEWWYVTNYSISSAVPAGTDALVVTSAYSSPLTNPQLYAIPNGIYQNTGVHGALMAACGGFWMPPNSELGLWINSIAATCNLLLGASLAYARLRV